MCDTGLWVVALNSPSPLPSLPRFPLQAVDNPTCNEIHDVLASQGLQVKVEVSGRTEVVWHCQLGGGCSTVTPLATWALRCLWNTSSSHQSFRYTEHIRLSIYMWYSWA